MVCPTCQFVAAPGQAAEEGVCPNCERPYRDQPSPTQSDMTMRNMPDPGGEDTGGNPLQEGILGDYQNRAVRDESFASVHPPLFYANSEIPDDPEWPPEEEPDIEIPADLVAVLPPKKQTKVAGPAAALIPAAGEALGIGAVGEAAGLGGAEAAGATSGGVGGLMGGALGGMNPAFMMGNMAGHLTDAIGGGVSAPPYQPQGQVEPTNFYATVHEGLATENDMYPGSHDHAPSNDTSDPEEVDPNEKNQDQKDMDLQVGMGVNDIGGTDQGWGPDSKGLNDFANLFPLILGYLHSDQGGDDPFISALHDSLDSENPGYLEKGNDEEGQKLLMAILTGAGLGQDNGNSDPSDPALQDNDAPHDPVQARTGLNQPSLTPQGLTGPGMKPLNTTQQPILLPSQGRCPTCGGTISPTDPVCPQCGSPNAQTRNAGTMGPANDEQKSALSQYLLDSGRGDEIPNMISQPWEYADELAQIAQREDPPEPPDAPPAPPAPPPAPGPEMGAPPGGAPPQGAGQPMMASMEHALNKAASRLSLTVDGLTGPCPKCDSHSTGIIDEDGTAGCKTCGNTFKSEDKPASDPKVKDGSTHFAEGLKNEIDAPAADQIGQYDPERQEDSSLAWQDSDGNPLIANHTYRLYSANYDIPDIVTVTDVKPGAVNFVIKSEFGLDAPTEVTYEDAQIEQYRFEPMKDVAGEDHNPQGGFEENPDDSQPGRPAPGEQTDLSTPHEMMSHRKGGLPDPQHSYLEALYNHANQMVEGGQMTPEDLQYAHEQEPESHVYPMNEEEEPYGGYDDPEEFGNVLNEVGSRDLDAKIRHWENFLSPGDRMSRNSVRTDEGTWGPLDETGTHPEFWNAPATGPSRCPNCGQDNANVLSDSCEHCGIPFNGPGGEPAEFRQGLEPTQFQASKDQGPDWLANEIVKQGGAKFTPMEQRTFVDEDGMARNQDLLDLSNTHYEMSDDPISDSFLW